MDPHTQANTGISYNETMSNILIISYLHILSHCSLLQKNKWSNFQVQGKSVNDFSQSNKHLQPPVFHLFLSHLSVYVSHATGCYTHKIGWLEKIII